jgi:hypothetical protein
MIKSENLLTLCRGILNFNFAKQPNNQTTKPFQTKSFNLHPVNTRTPSSNYITLTTESLPLSVIDLFTNKNRREGVINQIIYLFILQTPKLCRHFVFLK